jgi:hypothetical protein
MRRIGGGYRHDTREGHLGALTGIIAELQIVRLRLCMQCLTAFCNVALGD